MKILTVITLFVTGFIGLLADSKMSQLLDAIKNSMCHVYF